MAGLSFWWVADLFIFWNLRQLVQYLEEFMEVEVSGQSFLVTLLHPLVFQLDMVHFSTCKIPCQFGSRVKVDSCIFYLFLYIFLLCKVHCAFSRSFFRETDVSTRRYHFLCAWVSQNLFTNENWWFIPPLRHVSESNEFIIRHSSLIILDIVIKSRWVIHNVWFEFSNKNLHLKIKTLRQNVRISN